MSMILDSFVLSLSNVTGETLILPEIEYLENFDTRNLLIDRIPFMLAYVFALYLSISATSFFNSVTSFLNI